MTVCPFRASRLDQQKRTLTNITNIKAPLLASSYSSPVDNMLICH